MVSPTRSKPDRSNPVPASPPEGIDPIVLEIIQGTVESMRKEMELQVERTARSVIIRERRDYRAGVFDCHGRNVSSASAAASIEPIHANYAPEDIHEGDVFIWNDPFKSAGGITHLPDICITQPVFFQGEIAGYVQIFGHVLDIGGIVPGSMAIDAREIFQEGLRIPPVKLYERGKCVESLMRTLCNNSRYPDDLRGDIDAEVMACRAGARRFQGLLEMFGRETVDAALEAALEACAVAFREQVLPRIPDGRFEFEDFVEINGAAAAEPRRFIRIRVAMEKRVDPATGEQKLVFDFTGTDAQSAAAINIAGEPSYYVKYLMSIFRPMIPNVILNAGAQRVIEVILPEGSVLSAKYPAPCSYRAATLFRVPECCMGALSIALPEFGAGGSDLRNPWRYRGTVDGRPFLMADGIGAGGGGRRIADGLDAVLGGVHGMSLPVEYLENTYPIRIEEYALAPDSGGPGKHRGGHGVRKVCTLLAPGSLWVFADRQVLQSYGVAGGEAGQGVRFGLNLHQEDGQLIDRKVTDLRVQPGDHVTIETPGGGGWGDPLERDPALVLHDVLEGTVSREAARDRYGVVIDGEQVAAAETEALRQRMRGTRPPLRAIDRGERFAALEAAGEIQLTTETRLL